MIPFKLSPQCNPHGIMQNSPKTGLANQLSACLLWLIELLQEKGASLQVPPPPLQLLTATKVFLVVTPSRREPQGQFNFNRIMTDMGRL